MPTVPQQQRMKPLLRGVSHEIAAYLAAPALAGLLARAEGGSARVAALAFGTSLYTLFSVSALYHRPTWSRRARLVVGRLDHAAISLLIAGTHTPFCLLIGPGAGYRLLCMAWGGAALAITLAVAWPGAPKPLMAAVYVAVGWLFIPEAPAVRAAIGDGPIALVLAGGLAYTAGALVYSLRRPDPFPAVFGYHEIFHLLVVAGAVCHFLAVERAIRALG